MKNGMLLLSRGCCSSGIWKCFLWHLTVHRNNAWSLQSRSGPDHPGVCFLGGDGRPVLFRGPAHKGQEQTQAQETPHQTPHILAADNKWEKPHGLTTWDMCLNNWACLRYMHIAKGTITLDAWSITRSPVVSWGSLYYNLRLTSVLNVPVVLSSCLCTFCVVMNCLATHIQLGSLLDSHLNLFLSAQDYLTKFVWLFIFIKFVYIRT